MQPTPSQNKALSTERHLAITANAGSGKTRVLVQRYVDLFERYPDLTVRNVVAITFTENAAAELRAKISKEINERIKNTEFTKPDVRARLRIIRDSLPSAFIGTIHGFASRLLRAYPVEANIDASFTIVTGADQRLLAEDAIGSVFYSELEQAYQEPTENSSLHLFRTIGRHGVTNLVRTLLNNRMRAARITKDLLSKSDTDILAFWRAAIEHSLNFIDSRKTKDSLNELTRYFKSGKIAMGVLPVLQAYLTSTGFFETTSAFSELAKALITNSGTLRKNVIDEESTPANLLNEVEQLIETISQIRPLLDQCPANEEEYTKVHQQYLAQLRTAFAIYDQVLLEYSSVKNDYSLLDFDDMIEKFLALLDNQTLRSEITQEFRFVMIDEYQDTDESQFEIAKRLTENFGRTNNLAIVGDPKQAIYTFRNADPEVFSQTRDAIAQQLLSDESHNESTRLSLLPAEEQGWIELSESFRMTRTPLATINHLFRNLLSLPDQEYSELIHARETKLDGRVEWICPPDGKNKKDDDLSSSEDDIDENNSDEELTETTLIAQKIRSIVQHTDSDYDVEDKEIVRKPEYGDIAILLRSRGNLRVLERSLNQAQIPYVVSKGSGFFEQQEILDITSYLKFLTSPSNDIALTSILRSPFFAVSDVELFQIAHHNSPHRRAKSESWTFWRQFKNYAEYCNDTHLLRSLNQLQENIALSGRTRTALLIEKIYSESGIFASLQAAPQSSQKTANLEKFLAQARTADQSGFSGLLDFVDRIQYLTESEEQESQAELTSEQGAVHIMTVHAAKGLEFPIVILPFLQKKFNFDHQHLLDKQLGFQIRNPDDKSQPIIAELIHQRSKASTIAEEKRILYVAMTRARDHLILSSALPEKPNEHSWLAWISESFGVPESDNHLSFDEMVSSYDSVTQQVHAKRFHFSIPLIRFLSDIPQVPDIPSVDTSSIDPSDYIGPLIVKHTAGRFSATQLPRFKECPTKYHLSNILGMPEEPKLALDLEPDEYSEQVQGTLLGQIVHKTLEHVNLLAPTGILDEQIFKAEIGGVLDSLELSDEIDRAKYSAAALKHVANFIESTIALQVRSSTNSRTEFPLQTLLASGDTLFGIIDCLFQDPNGTWTILDYKTDSNPSKGISRYQFQLQFYAYLVHLMYSDAGTIRCILFFTATGETKEFQFTSSDLSNFADECSSLIQQIREQENITDLTLLPRNTDHCPECRFFDQVSNQCIVLTANFQNPTAIPAI
jgi:ATP-dependent helicase/nuclease subunit A